MPDARTAAAVIAVARSYVGVREDPPGTNANPFTTKLTGRRLGRAWCADFVTVCFLEAGARLPSIDIVEGFTGCPNAVRYATLAREIVAQAEPGDVALYDWNGDGVADHTELVVDVEPDGSLWTIGGNTGPATQYVAQQRRREATWLWRPTVALTSHPAAKSADQLEEDHVQIPVAPITTGELTGQWVKIRPEDGGHKLRSWHAPWAGVPDGSQDGGMGTFVLDVDAALRAGIGRPLVGDVWIGPIPGGVLVSDDHGDYAFRVAVLP